MDDAHKLAEEMGARVHAHSLTYAGPEAPAEPAGTNGAGSTAGNVVLLQAENPVTGPDISLRPLIAVANGEASELRWDWPSGARANVGRRLLRLRDLAETPGLAALFRVAAVAAPISAVLLTSGQRLSTPAFLTLLALLTVVWLAMQRAATASTRLSPFAVGIWAPSLVGAINGLIATAAITVAVGPDLRLGQILLMFAGVFTASCLAEALVVKLGTRTRLLLVGASDGASELLRDLAENPKLPFDWVGAVVDDVPGAPVLPLPVLGTLADLPRVVPTARPDLVVVADLEQRDRAIDHLVGLANVDFRIVGVPEIYEYALGRVPIQHLPPAWFMSLLHLYQRPYSRVAGRALDVTLAIVGILVAAPLYALIALGVRCTSRGPVFFRQERVGEWGRTFELVKFRTMVDGAENGQAVWAADDDKRVTGVGQFLRATRLDELPQLWNVLRGDMSVIGPRPERPEFLELLERDVPFWGRRLLIKPGITGWAQVRGGYASDTVGAAQKLSYDLYYLKHRSMWLDFAIFAKTAATVLSRSGAR
jgi:exopolysaccharide biosynthesis polyprenyl glycosylphosphotransferase